MICSGELDQRVTLQSLDNNVPARDAYGAPSQTWQVVATVWARVQPQSGREFVAAQAAQGELLYKVVLRYRADVEATWRVLWDGRILEIAAPPAILGRKEGILLTCRDQADPLYPQSAGQPLCK